MQPTRPSVAAAPTGRSSALRLRRLSEPRANEADVLAQEVDLVGEGAWKLEADDAAFDVVEALQQIGALLARGLRKRGALERHQLGVAAVNALAHAPAVGPRHELEGGNQNHDE